MPAAPERKMTVRTYVVLALVLTVIGSYIWISPYSLSVILLLAVISWVLAMVDRWKRRRSISNRAGESICTFVASFDCRRTDTWILRAIYEELSRNLAVGGHPMPIRAEDECSEKVLGIDGEDLNDLTIDIAFRAKRSLENAEQNPLYGKVCTVRDLVNFLEHQPRLETAKA
jgi:hypothetical protein